MYASMRLIENASYVSTEPKYDISRISRPNIFAHMCFSSVSAYRFTTNQICCGSSVGLRTLELGMAPPLRSVEPRSGACNPTDDTTQSGVLRFGSAISFAIEAFQLDLTVGNG